MDELVDLMEWTRQRVGPEGLVIAHNTMTPCAALENFADYIVAIEWGYAHLTRAVPRPDELPLEWSFMGSRSRGVIEYGTLVADVADQLRRQLGLLCLITGVAPWTASQTALELFEPLKGLDFSGYRFFDWRNPAIRLDNPALAGAIYTRGNEGLALVANLSSEPQQGRACLDPGAIGLPSGAAARGPETRALSRIDDHSLQVSLEAAGLALLEIR